MSSIFSKLINLAGNITGTLGVANGGTGTTTSTGSGSVVLNNTPSLTTPSLGVASATSLNKVTITTPLTGSTLTVADGKTLTSSNTLTFTGTDSSSIAFGAGGTVLYNGGALGTPASGNLSNCSSYPNVTQGTAGLVASAGQLLGTNTSSAASAGNVGEIIQSVFSSSANSPANGQWGNASSISLTAGQWCVTGAIYNTRIGGQTVMLLAVSAFSGNTTTDHVNGYNVSRGDWAPWNISSLSVGPWIVNIASTTTIYIKVQQDGGTFTAANWPGNITAFRMR